MIHAYSIFGQNIALDINSGAVHILDETAFEVLKAMPGPPAPDCPRCIPEKLPEYSKAHIHEAWSELYELYLAGLLFSDDDYTIASASAFEAHSPVKALCLHVAHDCNLRCSYCFASTGDFGTGRGIMNKVTAKKAVDFVFERSGSRRNIEIDFFGGEPLMAMDTVKETIEYARSLEKKSDKNFRFTITTNGLLLNDDIIKYINKNMDNIVLSLDGREEINDAMRKTPGGTGSYKAILPKFKKLVQGRGERDYYVRGTFTKNNLDFKEDVIHIASEGFKHISVEPVSANKHTSYSISENDLPKIFDEYESLARVIIEEPGFDFFHFNVDLKQGPCVIKRLRGCGAGYEYLAVTPEGDIYPCHQFVGIKDYKMGSVLTGEFNTDISNVFKAKSIYTRNACIDCWAKFYCSGGCSASNLLTGGSLDTPNGIACEMEKKRLECAIGIAAYKSVNA